MKYSEFKNAVEDWGRKYHYEPVIDEDPYNIYMKFDFDDDIVCDIVFEIYKLDRFGIDFNWGLYRNLSDDEKRDLFKIVTKFAATPIEEREDEKNNLDLIINRLKKIQAKATDFTSLSNSLSWSDFLNWRIEALEGRLDLKNNLEDVIRDLEEYKAANERE